MTSRRRMSKKAVLLLVSLVFSLTEGSELWYSITCLSKPLNL